MSRHVARNESRPVGAAGCIKKRGVRGTSLQLTDAVRLF